MHRSQPGITFLFPAPPEINASYKTDYKACFFLHFEQQKPTGVAVSVNLTKIRRSLQQNKHIARQQWETCCMCLKYWVSFMQLSVSKSEYITSLSDNQCSHFDQ